MSGVLQIQPGAGCQLSVLSTDDWQQRQRQAMAAILAVQSLHMLLLLLLRMLMCLHPIIAAANVATPATHACVLCMLRLWTQYDKNDDGTIDFEEFLDMAKVMVGSRKNFRESLVWKYGSGGCESLSHFEKRERVKGLAGLGRRPGYLWRCGHHTSEVVLCSAYHSGVVVVDGEAFAPCVPDGEHTGHHMVAWWKCQAIQAGCDRCGIMCRIVAACASMIRDEYVSDDSQPTTSNILHQVCHNI